MAVEGLAQSKEELAEKLRLESDRAERLLADSKLLHYVVQYGRQRLIGEDNTLLTNFVIICSGQTRYPISGVLTGFSGSGKNESIRAVKPLIPVEWIFEFTTSTPEAVKYIPENFKGTLVIYELGGMMSKTGTLGLRAVGEGESIETIFPIRDEETGEMMLGRHKTNARNFITTESDVDIHPDLYRRVLKVSLNHSDALTRRVLAKKLRDAMYPDGLRRKLGLNVAAKIPYSEKDFQNALRLLDWKVEVVLFPPSSLLELEKLAPTREQKVALRTQIERILFFVKVLAIIYQRQRTIIQDEADGYKAVVASPEDFETAMKILAPSIIETVSRVEKRQADALALIENTSEEHWDKDKLAQKLGVSTRTAARILKTLANLGYLREIQTTKPYSYELIQEREKPKQLVILEKANEYRVFYEKELKTFLTGIVTPCQNLHIILSKLDAEMLKNAPSTNTILETSHKETTILPLSPSFSKVELPELTPSKPTPKWQGVQMPSEALASFSEQTSQKQLAFSEMTSRKSFSETAPKGLLQCPFCAKQGVKMFWATQSDLEGHIRAFHTGYPDYVR